MGIKEISKKVAAKAAVLAMAAIGMVGAAHAELPAAVQATVTQIQSDAQGLFDIVFPVVGTIVGLVIVIKLFKRFANKV